MKKAPLVKNPGHTTFSHALARRRFVQLDPDRQGRQGWPRGWPRGEYRWQAGDRALVHLGAVLPWTLAELELVAVLEDSRRYGAVVRRFDGVARCLGGLSLGDKLRVDSEHFFALWTVEEARVAIEQGRKPYEKGSMR